MPSKDQAGKTLATARRITLTPATRTYRDWVGNTDTKDLYRLTLNRRSSLNLTLDGLKANATLKLLNFKGKPLQVSANADRQRESIYRNLLPGTYFLQVSPVKGNTAYRLKAAAIPDGAGDRINEALNLGTPTTVTLQDWVGQSDPDDYYQISLPSRSQLSLGWQSPTAATRVQVLDATGGAIATLLPTGNSATSTSGVLEAGTYYIRVNLNQPNTSTYYSLNVALDPSPINIAPIPEPIPNPLPNPIPDPIPNPIPNPIPDPIPDPVPNPGLVFQFSTAAGTSPAVMSALIAAGNLWSNRFSDNVTLDVAVRFSDESPGAASTLIDFSYAAVRAALVSDQTSAEDAIALTHLPNASAFNMLLNYTTNSPKGSESPVAYLDNDGDANNRTIRMTTSNAKALGLQLSDGTPAGSFLGGDESRDLVIILPETSLSGFPWDFDRSDGIAAGAVDFIGIVAHEIGHALGFSSGVDILDRGAPRNDEEWTWVNTLDLFRYSAASVAAGSNVIDWTTSNTNKYFSIDGGTTQLASFGRGIVHGDGIFPGHWKQDSAGFMSATLSPFIGQKGNISNLDALALDVIGWDNA